ncbi:MAG: multifunctional CCA addition/repair protein [Chromatiales bacterium]|jgi:tRNA nucleotidyltransferase (CCA-adding enzyme)|nr:multifunctional CCA addition/repair protein [Chromatiales bacterium]
MKVYIVGGAVRDRLLGLPVRDRDWVVVGATPEQMLAQGFRQVGKDFPVFLHPRTKEEYALARTERKVAAGYHGFTMHASPEVTLEEDLMRRDLTINAMAQTENGELIDPYDGAEDLRRRVLRHVSPAFSEDPVRILRLARFAARFAPLGFTVAPKTVALMQNMVRAGEGDALVPERVWQELERALGEARPSAFFETLRSCNALAVLFPELDRLWGVPQPEKWHPEIDTGIHTMLVLEAAARLTDDRAVRFAALTHDLGKGTTPREEWPRHIAHEQRSAGLVTELCRRLRVPTEYRELALVTARHHGQCHDALKMRPSTVLRLLEALDAFRRPQRFEQFLLACEADFRGRPGYEELEYPQPEKLRRAQQAAAAVSGAELAQAGFTGKALGDELARLRAQAIAALEAA